MHNLKNALFSLGVVFIAFLFSSSSHALEIKGVRFGAHGNAVRIVMDMDTTADFRAMAQENPTRIAVDLPLISGKPAIARSMLPPIVSDIRLEPLVTPTGTYSRMSLMLESKAVVRSAFMMPAEGKQLPRLVLDLAPASPESFAKQVGKAYGNLSIATAAATPAPAGKLPFAGIGGAKLEPIGKPESPKAPEELPLIVIDAGHGGQDSGAVQSGVREKDVTLAVARDLRTVLLATGKYRVELTRDKDIFIRLPERVRIGRRLGADLFISIHADSAPDAGSAAKGASFYTISETASDTLAAGLAARENQADMLAGVELPTEDKEVANILIDLTMRETVDQSRFFSGQLATAFRKNNLPLLESPRKSAGFVVLKAPDIPSVLIELGFLSNPDEAKKLTNNTYRTSLANSISAAVDAWFAAKKP
ncbi:MAG: N-acetylmuramoyl-L-alanine amidase [Alphaproteobacteria bacterium]|nr:N-acetylmuramoyl-L-alanine amidase [Alphaproteobacteria bacterium]